MKQTHPRNLLRFVTAISTASAILFHPALHAGAYIFAGEANGIDAVTHPKNYNGTGGTVTANVCFVDNADSSPFEMVAATSVDNVVNTWNRMQAVTPNLSLGNDNNVPAGQIDFESVLLHEIGHCIGLAHVNAASESGLAGSNQNFTKAADGEDDTFNIGAGTDGIIGSLDDVRGDDINLHWFRLTDNNPFLLSTPVDGSNYSRDTANLPSGHLFAENADRAIGQNLRGFPNTEAVMQQGTFADEDQRSLMADGVSTRLLANAGIDRIAGNSDDYDLELVNLGVRDADDPECDITVEFSTETSLAVCFAGGSFLNGTNIAISSARSAFSPNVAWFFNDVSNADGILAVTKSASPEPVETGGKLDYSIRVDAIGADQTGISLTDDIPDGTTLVSESLSCGGTESGGTITFPVRDLNAGQFLNCGFSVDVNLPGSTVTFTDDMEAGIANWLTTQSAGTTNWLLQQNNPSSGSNAWFGENTGAVTDFALQLANAVSLPADSELIFRHDFELESTFDGGVLEISTNGGSSWSDLGPQITQGGYNSVIDSRFSNPLAGRSAWSGTLGGYQEVVVDLSSFAGQNALFRWRIGTDNVIAADGWYVDDVSIENRVRVNNTACATSNERPVSVCDSTSTTVQSADSDNDGLPDAYEIANGLDPNDDGSININNGPNGDLDGDGLSNLDEFNAGTGANNPDTDGDGLGDALDQAPLEINGNACTEDGMGDAEFNITSPSGLITQCAATRSVTARSSATFQSNSVTQIISPTILLDAGFRIPVGSVLHLRAQDPVPGSSP